MKKLEGDNTDHQNIRDFRFDMREYLRGNHGFPFGSFITALLANDLVGALGRADATNHRLLAEYARILYNEMPGRTDDPTRDYWGSYEAVANRIKEQRTNAERCAP